MEPVQRVQVAVVDNIVSRSVCGVCTDNTSGCGGQYCRKKCKWSLYREDQWLKSTVHVLGVKTLPVSEVDSIVSKSECEICTDSTSGCSSVSE